MARYIDADSLLKKIWYDNSDSIVLRSYAAELVKAMPTADVVPKSEVDLYRKQVDELEDELASTYDKLEVAKAEVAREIFEEIEQVQKEIVDRMQEFINEWKQYSESTVDYFGGKYDAMETASRIVKSILTDKTAELKKEIHGGKIMNELSNPKEFALAGNAVITLESENTGNRFTYKITRADDNHNLFFVKLLVGPDNTADYSYIGCYYSDSQYFHPNKKYKEIDRNVWPASMRAIYYFFKNIDNIPSKLHVYHEGKCGRCGRRLTTPESILLGFGPECVNKL
jgi:hypothetical protein